MEVVRHLQRKLLKVLPSSDARAFFEEVGAAEEDVRKLRTIFQRFCDDEGGEQAGLSLDAFRRFISWGRLCAPDRADNFFYAMDRDRDGRLNFDEFQLGCLAASVTSVHIINSFTGYERLQFAFDFYNTSRAGTLSYAELSELLAACGARMPGGWGWSADKRPTMGRIAQHVGDIDTVTLTVGGLAGPLGSIRASKAWSWLSVKREIAQRMGVDVEEQKLVLGLRVLPDHECVSRSLESGASSLDVTAVFSGARAAQTETAVIEKALSETAEEEATDGEDVTFARLYKAMQDEQLRGTSRLFRFTKRIQRLR